VTPVSFTQGVQAFQNALRLRLAAGEDGPVRELCAGLPAETLRAFADLTEASFLVRCVLDARVLEKAFSRFDIHPRSLLGREFRPSRLLEAPRRERGVLECVLTESLHTRPASLLIRLMGEYPDASLSVLRPDGRRRQCPSSVLSLMSLVLREGESVTFEAEGEGALAMLARLEKINAGGWKRWDATEELKTPPVLPSTNTLTLWGIVKAAETAMREFGVGELCGVLDRSSMRLFFGRPEWGHGGTALAAGLASILDYARVNFRRTGTGAIAAYFPESIPFENIGGYLVLRSALRAILSPGAASRPK
jgi:phosphotransferase system HPr (HPr) family protein